MRRFAVGQVYESVDGKNRAVVTQIRMTVALDCYVPCTLSAARQHVGRLMIERFPIRNRMNHPQRQGAFG
jgi:hypothetical protein